jgi:hypothetical protein
MTSSIRTPNLQTKQSKIKRGGYRTTNATQQQINVLVLAASRVTLMLHASIIHHNIIVTAPV